MAATAEADAPCNNTHLRYPVAVWLIVAGGHQADVQVSDGRDVYMLQSNVEKPWTVSRQKEIQKLRT